MNSLPPSSSPPIHSHRALFPGLAGCTYFNYGGQGMMARPTHAAIAQNFARMDELGAFSQAANAWAIAETQALKTAIATELNAPASAIALTENTTAGCNLALWSIPWQPGDRLLLSDCEHQSVLAIAGQLQRRFAIATDVFPLQATADADDCAVLAALEAAWHPRTRAVALSHVCWNTGQIVPLREIVAFCRDRGAWVVVDAAQSVGAIPVDLTALDPDFYAFTGHKWWCGPVGVGGLYVRPGTCDRLDPAIVGWRGVRAYRPQSPASVALQPDARGFEVATSAYPLYGALRVALEVAQQWGTSMQRYDRLRGLSHTLWQRLRTLPRVSLVRQTPPMTGLVAFAIAAASPVEISQRLEAERHLLVRAIPHPNCLRASVHYLTTEEEIEALVEAIAAL